MLHQALEVAREQHDVPTMERHRGPHLVADEVLHGFGVGATTVLLPQGPVFARHEAQDAGVLQRDGCDISAEIPPRMQQVAVVVVPGNVVPRQTVVVDNEQVPHVWAAFVGAKTVPKIQHNVQTP